MRDKLRKAAQKKINHNVRAMNRNIQNDNLWRGRFYCHQMRSFWEKFDDNSGGILKIELEIRDKKTGTFWTVWLDNYDRGWKLFEYANKFIAEYSHVWDNIEEVKQDKTDWSKVKWEPKNELFSPRRWS